MDDNSINLQYIQQKPWGNFENFIKSKNYLVKILNIEVGHEISLQKHRFRDEHWVILQGPASLRFRLFGILVKAVSGIAMYSVA